VELCLICVHFLLSGRKKYMGINCLFGWPKITVNIVRIKTVIHISEDSRAPVNEGGRRQGPQRKKEKRKHNPWELSKSPNSKCFKELLASDTTRDEKKKRTKNKE
jgi:hypothetical protein